jgi:fructose-1-phosphate kinase PfkB-like protein
VRTEIVTKEQKNQKQTCFEQNSKLVENRAGKRCVTDSRMVLEASHFLVVKGY